MKTYTYGVLPTLQVYTECWNKIEIDLRDGLFHFGNDSRVGTGVFNEFELWDEINTAFNEDTVDSLDWVSGVLQCLGIEWI